MANKGLRNGTKQLETKIGSVATAYANLYNNDANLIIEIPLVNFDTPVPLNLSLIYNQQTKDTNEPFLGYGMRFNFYTSITYSNNSYYVTTVDGATYQYNYISSSYINNETKNLISKNSVSGTYYYKITDKLGNYIEYREGYNYPSKIHYASGFEINFDLYNSSDPKITSSLYEIHFQKFGTLITGISYSNSDPENPDQYDVVLSYSSNRINSVTLNGKYPNKKIFNMSFNGNYLITEDDVLKIRNTYYIVSNKVLALEEKYYYNSYTTVTYVTSITYYSYKTRVTNYLNENTYYYFGDNGTPTYEIDDKNRAISYEYNSNGLLTYESALIKCNNIIGNINQTITSTYSYTFYTRGIKEDNLLLVAFVKINGNISSNSVSLSINSQTKYLSKLYNDGENELICIGINASETKSSYTLSINTSGYSVTLKGLAFINHDIGICYEYDSFNNIISMKNNAGTTSYTYNSNRVSGIVYPNGTIKSYSYSGTYPKPYTITSSLGKVINYEYLTATEKITKEEITDSNASYKLENRYGYNNYGRLLHDHYDERNYSDEFQYNEYGLNQIMDKLGRLTQYTYKTNSQSTNNDYGATSKISRGSNEVSFDYDNRYNVNDVKSKTLNTDNSRYYYTRNSLNNLTTVTLNSTLFVDNTYNSELLTKIKYGNNADSFNFSYDDSHKLSGISYQAQNNGTISSRYSFTYNNYEELITVSYANSNIGTKNIEYTNDGLVSKISSLSSYSYNYRYNGNRSLAFKDVLTNNYKKSYAYGNDDLNIVTKIFGNNQSVLSSTKIFPLQNGVISFDEFKPNVFNSSTAKPFKYDNVEHTMYLDIYNVKLTYDFSLSTDGTLMARIYTTSYGKQYIFYNIDSNDNTLALYVQNGYLYIEYNQSYIQTNLSISLNTWYTVGLSYDSQIVGNSGTSNTHPIKVYLNGSVYDTAISHSFDSFITYIGRDDGDNYRLSGGIYNLASKNESSSTSSMNSIRDEICGISITKELNVYGLISSKTIKPYYSSSLFLDKYINHSYQYEKRPQTTNYLTKLINKETISTGVTTFERSYGYLDYAGKVTSITNNSNFFGNHSFSYNSSEFLTSETFNGNTINYTYDDNGNILTAGNTSFSYDSTIKDRLKSVGGSIISYSSNNPLNPTSFDGWSYRYEGRRLVEAEKDNSYEDIKITFTYDEEGNIIRRDYYYYSYEDEYEETQTTTYYYESGKLVTEVTPYVRNDYLYDSEGNLIGFIVNNTTKYFYITDILSNIIGIVDESGNIVTRYYTDAYGYNMIISGNTSIYNPFRYKGYYWDSDIEMYWCKSRFYVPYWRRWLNADSIEYLDINNVGCVNLFAYCNNNPVMYSDGDGHFPGFITAMLIGAVLGGVYGGISASINNQSILGGILIGALTGALTGVFTEVLSPLAVVLSTYAVGFGGDVLSQVVLDGKSFAEIDVYSATWAGIINSTLAMVGKGLTVLGEHANFKFIENVIFATITNSPLIGLGMSANIAISRIGHKVKLKDFF